VVVTTVISKAAIPKIPASFPLVRDEFMICVLLTLLWLVIKSQPAIQSAALPIQAQKNQRPFLFEPALKVPIRDSVQPVANVRVEGYHQDPC
jgi:hypothetical protein